MSGFASGERHIQLDGLAAANIKDVLIRAHLGTAADVFDLLLAENALRHKFGIGLKLHLELPYLPYARQDRVCAPGQAFSLQVFTNLLKMLRLSKLVTWDCHSRIGLELSGAVNVSAAEIIASDESLAALLQAEGSVLVCPDKGAVNRCEAIKETLKLEQMVQCDKQRDPITREIYRTEVLAGTVELEGKCAIVVDDICDGGQTLIKIAEQLREKQVARVVLFATHGIFSKGLNIFDGLADEIITTNSLLQQSAPNLRVIDYQYNF